jgi:hypothetical protein
VQQEDAHLDDLAIRDGELAPHFPHSVSEE